MTDHPERSSPFSRTPRPTWSWGRFYLHFASAYGTFWLVLMAAAVIGQTHIDAGAFGLIGFPVIAGLYAVVRLQQPTPESVEIARLRRQMADRDAP